MKKYYALLCTLFVLAGCSGRGDGSMSLAGFNPELYYSAPLQIELPTCRNNMTMSGALSQKCAQQQVAPAPVVPSTVQLTPAVPTSYIR